MYATKYLIIGNSAGGIGAAESIRERDSHGTVTIISNEICTNYSRPLISKYLSKQRSFSEMVFRPDDFYTQNRINLISNKRVVELDLENHSARLDDDENIFWDKLLLATGGKPIIPAISGIDNNGVFTFTSIDDAEKIDGFVPQSHSAVVIGGGLIGMSVTEALTQRGLDVTVIEMKDRILNTILDKTASGIAENILKQANVTIHTEHTVTAIQGNGQVHSVILDNKDEIAADMVIMAIGVSPRADLAINTGIFVNRGIVVNRHMQTNYPNVYACGDVAEAYDFIHEDSRVIPIWPGAYIGGRIAGNNMSNGNSEYPGVTSMNSLNYFGMDIVSAGIVNPPLEDGYEVLSKTGDNAYKKLVLNKNRIVGMIFTGDIEKSGIIFSLMREGVDISSFRYSLIEDDFGLAKLPAYMWKKRLECSS